MATLDHFHEHGAGSEVVCSQCQGLTQVSFESSGAAISRKELEEILRTSAKLLRGAQAGASGERELVLTTASGEKLTITSKFEVSAEGEVYQHVRKGNESYSMGPDGLLQINQRVLSYRAIKEPNFVPGPEHRVYIPSEVETLRIGEIRTTGRGSQNAIGSFRNSANLSALGKNKPIGSSSPQGRNPLTIPSGAAGVFIQTPRGNQLENAYYSRSPMPSAAGGSTLSRGGQLEASVTLVVEKPAKPTGAIKDEALWAELAAVRQNLESARQEAANLRAALAKRTNNDLRDAVSKQDTALKALLTATLALGGEGNAGNGADSALISRLAALEAEANALRQEAAALGLNRDAKRELDSETRRAFEQLERSLRAIRLVQPQPLIVQVPVPSPPTVDLSGLEALRAEAASLRVTALPPPAPKAPSVPIEVVTSELRQRIIEKISTHPKRIEAGWGYSNLEGSQTTRASASMGPGKNTGDVWRGVGPKVEAFSRNGYTKIHVDEYDLRGSSSERENKTFSSQRDMANSYQNQNSSRSANLSQAPNNSQNLNLSQSYYNPLTQYTSHADNTPLVRSASYRYNSSLQ